VEDGYAQNPVAKTSGEPPRRGRRKQSKARNLLDRFRDHPDGILAFMRDFSVPFDNNLSERDLRMMKLRQKISGTFRSFDALVDFCRIRGYVSTARKNGINALDALRRVFLGRPLYPRRLHLVAALARWPAPPLRIMPSIWTNYRLAKILLIL
jgi:transposase